MIDTKATAASRSIAERQSVEPAAASEPTPLDFVGQAAVAALTLGLCWFVGLT